MNRFFNSIAVSVFLIVLSTLLICTLPQDPRENPDALKAEVIIPDSVTSAYVGKPVTFAVKVHYPMNAKRITGIFGDGIRDSVITLDKPPQSDEATWYFTCIFNTSGTSRKFIIELQATDDNIKRYYSRAFDVLPEKFGVVFDTIPPSHLVAIGNADTMIFTAVAKPSGSPVDFTIKSQPPLDPKELTVIDEGSRVRVIVISKENKNYIISCYAHSATEHDTANVELITYQYPAIKTSSGKDTIKAGTIDTLIFTKQSGTTDTLALTLLNRVDTNVIKILQTKQDSIQLVFEPDSIKTYTFLIQVRKGNLYDTITYQKVVGSNPVSIWKQQTATSHVFEGTLFSYTFSMLLTDSNRTDIVFASSRGTVDNKSIKYSVPWGSNQKDSILISATANGTVSEFKLILNVASADSSKPKLTLVAPVNNPFKTNDSKVTCKFSAEDPGAGIALVVFTRDGTTITDTSRNDSLYSCNIYNLVHGIPVIVKMVVTDGSIKKNRDSIMVTITRDSTLEDKAGPKFSIISDPRKDGRVLVDTGTISVSIEDASGIADNGVIAKLNGIAISGVTKSGNVFSIPYKLTDYGQNAISIIATDNSTAKNSDTLIIAFTYNTSPAPLVLVSPSDNAQEIDTFPTIKWTGGNDADGDTVLFKVRYGTSATALTSQTPEYANVNEIKFTTKLSVNTTYYWSVIGQSKKTSSDSVILGPYSFKTVNPDRKNPVIRIISPSPYTTGMRVTTATNTISLTASDENGIDSVYYTINSDVTKTMVPGNNGTYTFSYTLPRRGLDTITIAAVDMAELHNKTTTQVIVNYNTPLPATITLWTPANNATEIAVLAPFSWTEVNDEDRDVVFYVVEYSLVSDFKGSSFSDETPINSVTLTTGNALDYNTKYYYRVIGYTKAPYQDTTWSTARFFNTINKTFRVSFSSNGAIIITQSVVANELVQRPANPGLAGYAFDNWYADSALTQLFDFVNTHITGPVTIYAKWTETVTDYDGNVYRTVKIGNKTWTNENLRTRHYQNGDSIPIKNLMTEIGQYSTCNNQSDSAFVKEYGLLYNWYAVGDSRKLAPPGWHIANEEDMNELYLLPVKSLAATSGWNQTTYANTPGFQQNLNNSTGFSGLAGGYYGRDNSYHYFGSYGYWWSSTTYYDDGDITQAYYFRLGYNEASSMVTTVNKSNFHSVRFVKD